LSIGCLDSQASIPGFHGYPIYPYVSIANIKTLNVVTHLLDKDVVQVGLAQLADGCRNLFGVR
jgi:hypothetical protein